MNTGNSIPSFWHSYAAVQKATKLLTGKAEPLVPDPLADAVRADESPGDTTLEVVEYH
jgi:hypothetical protein